MNFLAKSSHPENKTTLPHPLLMRESEIDTYLVGTRTHRSIRLRRKMFHHLGDQLFGPEPSDSNFNFNSDPSSAGGNRMRRSFLWAMGIVQSRAISSSTPGPTMPFSLVPGIDFANHSSGKENAVHSYNEKKLEFHLVASKRIEAGEVRYSYTSLMPSQTVSLLFEE
jgi:hypothetical protein